MPNGRRMIWVALVVAAASGLRAAVLPQGYTRLRYVESDGTQYVDTGYRPTNTDRIQMGIRFSGGQSTYALFDARDDDITKNRLTVCCPYGTSLRVDRGVGNSVSVNTTQSLQVGVDSFVDFDGKAKTFCVNGQSWLPNALPETELHTLTNTLVVLAMRTNCELGYMAKVRIYSFKVSDAAGNVKVDMVPCRGPDGTVGLYDFAAGELRSAAAGNGLAAGEAVDQRDVSLTAYDETTGRVTIALPAIDREMSLVAVWGPEDFGLGGLWLWPNFRFVKRVLPGGAAAVDVDVPDDVDVGADVVRLFLVDCLCTEVGTPVKYLGSHHAEWIETGVVPDGTTSIRLEMELLKQPEYTGDHYVPSFGISQEFFLFRNGAKFYYGWLQGAALEVDGPNFRDDGMFHAYRLGPGGAFVDDTKLVGAFASAPYSTTRSIPLFGRRSNADGNMEKLDACRISSAVIEKGGAPVRDLRPCVLNGIVGLYDVVRNELLVNQGAGAFDYEPYAMPDMMAKWAGCSEPLSTVAARDVRSVAVDSFDPVSGEVTLSVSAGLTAKRLYVARADRVADLGQAAWSDFAEIGLVPAGATSFSAAVPPDLLRQGDLRFVLARQIPDRMREATPCDYLVADGDGAYLDTEYVPNGTDKVSLRFKPLDLPQLVGFFDARDGSAHNRLTALWNGGLRVDLGLDAAAMNSLGVCNLAVDGTYDLVADFNARKVLVSNVVTAAFVEKTLSEPQTMPTLANTLIALAFRTGGVPGNFAKAWLYSLKVTDAAGNDRVDLVPYSKNGVGQMYDRVRGCFVGSPGTGAFRTGGDLRYASVKAVESEAVVSCGPKVDFSVDSSAKKVSVTLSGRHDAGRLLIAGASQDMGADVFAWPNVAEICPVAAADGLLVADLPVGWKHQKYCRVFYVTETTFCPFDYRLDSLGSSREQWLDTGVAPDVSTTFRMSVLLPTLPYQSGLDSYPPSFGVASHYFMFRNSEALWYGWFGKTASVPCEDLRGNGVRELEFGPCGGFVDGVERIPASELVSSGAEATKLTITLFGRRQSADSVNKLDGCTIYWATIEKGGRLVRDFVPCVKDGEAGLYDRVGGEFYGNQGSGTFLPGTALAGGFKVDARDVLSASETKRVRTGFVAVVR